jgi:FMN-dependent dehydrogenase
LPATDGHPRFSNLLAYTGSGRKGGGHSTTLADALFAPTAMGGAFTWEGVARYRDRWRRPLVVKGILHPQDAEKAVSLGVDGLVVSNHGGRQIEALPAAIDALPAIAAQIGSRATVLMGSGIRSGVDVGRALALGAAAAFAGKAFLPWGLGALGEAGPGHVIDLLIEELRATLGQIGAAIATVRKVQVRHPGALGRERGRPSGPYPRGIADRRVSLEPGLCATLLWHRQFVFGIVSSATRGGGAQTGSPIPPLLPNSAKRGLSMPPTRLHNAGRSWAVGAPVVKLRQ